MRSVTLVVILAFVAPAWAATPDERISLDWAERPKKSSEGVSALFIRHLGCNYGVGCELMTTELRCVGHLLSVHVNVRHPPDLKVTRVGEWVHLEVNLETASQTHKLKVRKGIGAGMIFSVIEASGVMVWHDGDKIDVREFEPITNPAFPLPCNKVAVPVLAKR